MIETTSLQRPEARTEWIRSALSAEQTIRLEILKIAMAGNLPHNRLLDSARKMADFVIDGTTPNDAVSKADAATGVAENEPAQ